MTTDHFDDALRRAVLWVASLNLAYFSVEFAVALTIGSVSLFADSVDFLEDALVNVLILVALGWTARNRARVGMALAAILLVPGLATLWTAWEKFNVPVAPSPFALSTTAIGALAINLRARGYEVTVAADGAAALTAASRQPPDAVVLDLGLPDMDGTQVIEGLRGWTQVPIIVLSARTGEPDKVVALDAGADDYVTKPFGMDELLARLRAALRRQAPGGEAPVVRTAAFTVDLAVKTAHAADGTVVRLTPTEWQLLEVLVRNRGKLVGQRQLLQDVWGPQYERETNYLRVYMAQLRRKLELDPSHPRHLLTEPGMGYRFVGAEEPN